MACTRPPWGCLGGCGARASPVGNALCVTSCCPYDSSQVVGVVAVYYVYPSLFVLIVVCLVVRIVRVAAREGERELESYANV